MLFSSIIDLYPHRFTHPLTRARKTPARVRWRPPARPLHGRVPRACVPCRDQRPRRPADRCRSPAQPVLPLVLWSRLAAAWPEPSPQNPTLRNPCSLARPPPEPLCSDPLRARSVHVSPRPRGSSSHSAHGAPGAAAEASWEWHEPKAAQVGGPARAPARRSTSRQRRLARADRPGSRARCPHAGAWDRPRSTPSTWGRRATRLSRSGGPSPASGRARSSCGYRMNASFGDRTGTRRRAPARWHTTTALSTPPAQARRHLHAASRRGWPRPTVANPAPGEPLSQARARAPRPPRSRGRGRAASGDPSGPGRGADAPGRTDHPWCGGA